MHPRGDSGTCILLAWVYHPVIPEKGLDTFHADPGKRGIRLSEYAICAQWHTHRLTSLAPDRKQVKNGIYRA